MKSKMNAYADGIGQIRGRLHMATAFATMYLLDGQNNRLGVKGNCLEIGVLGGRYLALMTQFLKEGEKAFGIDPFYLPNTSPEQVRAAIIEAGCNENFEIIKARSDRFSHDDYKEKWGPVRFFHIDGSHQRDDVILDLAIADAILQDDGLIAFDDFLNPYWIGVTEALFRYFERNPQSSLVPIGYCRNKLFLARKPHAASYAELFADFIEDHPERISIAGGLDRESNVMGVNIKVLH